MVNGDPVPTYADGTPAGLEVLATAPARLISITDDALRGARAPCGPTPSRPVISKAWPRGCSDPPRPRTSPASPTTSAVMGTFTKGKGRVFNAGTTDWCYGLDSDPLVQQVTAQRHPLAHRRRLNSALPSSQHARIRRKAGLAAEVGVQHLRTWRDLAAERIMPIMPAIDLPSYTGSVSMPSSRAQSADGVDGLRRRGCRRCRPSSRRRS